MVFSSAIFLFVFLPVVFCLYLIPSSIKVKNGLLIFASILFYAFGEPIYVLLMIVSTFMNYMVGKLLRTGIMRSTKGYFYQKSILVVAIIMNIGILCIFKYAAFIIESVNTTFQSNFYVPNIPLPIGISFFTFQSLSYVIDVYRNVVLEQKNFFYLLLYISYFPQLVAGPIIQYQDIEQQLEIRKQDINLIIQGIQRLIKGLFKKLFFANSLGCIVDAVFELDIAEYSFLVAWLGAVCYALQIYYDFSGYSDMAIGLANMFGFRFKENFEHPYSACSIKEFWHKWHISLSTWFKEYVYIPLGGSHEGKLKTERNKMIVFLLTGIWHGANWTFVLWGLIHGMASILEDTILPVHKITSKIIRNFYTLFIVIIAFVIFRSDTVSYGLLMIKAMFVNWFIDTPSIIFLMEQLDSYHIFFIGIGVLFVYPISGALKNKLKHKVIGYPALVFVVDIVLLLLCMLNLASISYNPFIYFRF